MSAYVSIAQGGPMDHLTSVYPADYWQPLMCLLYLVGVTLLGFLITARVRAMGPLRQTSGPKIAVVMVMLDSYAYVFTSAMLTLGVGTSRNRTSCGIGVWICISLYASTKFLITVFFIERTHIVHGESMPRRKSKLYLFHCLIAAGWIGLLIGFILRPNRGVMRNSDHACVYELNHNTIISTIAFDICVDLYFVLIFAIPLWRGHWAAPRLRTIAVKSLVAAVVAIISSAANMLVIILLRGRELSWMCLALCTLDTLANALTLFWVTKRDRSSQPKAQLPPPDKAPQFYLPPVSSFAERPFPSTIMPYIPPFTNYASQIASQTGGHLESPAYHPSFPAANARPPPLRSPPIDAHPSSPKSASGESDDAFSEATVDEDEESDAAQSPPPRIGSTPGIPDRLIITQTMPSPSLSVPQRALRFLNGRRSTSTINPSTGSVVSSSDNPASWRGDIRARFRSRGDQEAQEPSYSAMSLEGI